MTRTRSIWIKSLVAGLLTGVGTLYFVGHEALVSVGLGVGIATINFWLLERLVTGLVDRNRIRRRQLLIIFLSKAALLFGVLGYVVLKVPIQAGPFLLGLSCIVMGIVLEGITGLFSSREILD